jgi:mono/diheme cytochrome c family protein
MPRGLRAAAFACVIALAAPWSAAHGADEVAGADEHASAERGEYIFHAAGCAACHTAKGGPPLAGGVALNTPFGRFYTPNITPDPHAGIGDWSLANFERALWEGRAPDGKPYYPSFPYTSYTGMEAADVADLWAYLKTVEPSAEPSRPHELSFPFSLRAALHGWQFLFFEPGRFQADPNRDETWNRGAYLVHSVSHCGECHTPRNLFGALDRDRWLAGNPDGPEGKRVPNITPDEKGGIGKWSATDITFYLEIGFEPKGDVAGGAMKQVIDETTSHLTPEDRKAIAAYLQSLPPLPDASR